MAKHVYPRPSIIKSIQYVSVDITTGTSNTATINAVDPNKTIVIGLGSTGEDNDYEVNLSCNISFKLTDSTTVTAERSYSTSYDSFGSCCVVEFNDSYPFSCRGDEPFLGAVAGVKSVQSGVIELRASTSATATINTVDVNKTMLVLGGLRYIGNMGSYTSLKFFPKITLTDSTTITASRVSYYSTNTYIDIVYYVIEFY